MPRAQSLAAALLCIAFPFALAACGGGGAFKVEVEDVTQRPTAGTQQPAPTETPQPATPPAPPPVMSEPPPATFETLPATRTTAEADHHRVRAAGFEKTLQSAKEAAVSLPRFGSVIQGTDSDADGVTTDRVSTEFDWGPEAELASRTGVLGVQWNANPETILEDSNLTVTIAHDNGVRITIDADDATDTRRLPTGTFSIIRPYDQGSRTWYTADHTDTTATFSRVAVTTDAGAPDWWIAKGYYLRLAGRNLLSTAPTVTAAYMGAFVDGDDLTPTRGQIGQPYIPPTGTARYEGLGSGIYTTQYGTGYALPEGSTEFGEFEGTTTLTANFADNTISGCFGCEGDVRLTGVFTNSETGAQGPALNTLSGYQFRLGEAQINPDGTFRANAVTLSNSNLQEGVRITEQGGSWGGRFSRTKFYRNRPTALGRRNLWKPSHLERREPKRLYRSLYRREPAAGIGQPVPAVSNAKPRRPHGRRRLPVGRGPSHGAP